MSPKPRRTRIRARDDRLRVNGEPTLLISNIDRICLIAYCLLPGIKLNIKTILVIMVILGTNIASILLSIKNLRMKYHYWLDNGFTLEIFAKYFRQYWQLLIVENFVFSVPKVYFLFIYFFFKWGEGVYFSLILVE